MDCTKVESLISDYSVGLLSDKVMADLEAHVESCSGCRSALEKFEQVMSMVDTLPAMEPPAGLWNGVYNRIAVDAPAPRTIADRIRDAFPYRRVGWSAAIGGAGLAAVLVLSHFNSPAPAPVYASGEYVQGHAIFASQEFLADQVALTSAATIADRDGSGSRPE